jgi:anti-anti-sigma factor
MGQQEAFSKFSFSAQNVDIQINNGIAVVKCVDRIDIYNSPAYDTAIDMLIKQSDNSVLFNMEEVFYIDSSGLGVLISSKRRLNSAGRFFKIIGPGDFVRKVLHRSRMTTYFDIYDTEEDALKSIDNPETTV